MREVEQRVQGIGSLSILSAGVCSCAIVRVRRGCVMVAMRCPDMAARRVMRQFMQFAERSEHRHQGHSQRKQAQHEHAQGERKALARMDHGQQG